MKRAEWHACAWDDHAKKGKRKRCRGNPLCCFGVGEQAKGNVVWGGPKELQNALGPDPSLASRAAATATAPAPPVGIRNIGATCYLASLLQVLFMNVAFRGHLYSVPELPPGTAADVVSALQNIFANLELSTTASCDIKELAKMLNVEHVGQQDPQEFGKLFMDCIETCVAVRNTGAAWGPPPAAEANFVDKLFRGSQEYTTTCSVCKTQSKREEKFAELEVAVAGNKSVQACCDAHFVPEVLQGDNQYLCEKCGHKVDATRHLQGRDACDARRLAISRAPPVLSVQLLRYVYDRATQDKKKLRDGIVTDATLKVYEDGEAVDYDLVAVVLHKGETAHGGHYVAQALEWAQRRWFQFDDETVTAVPSPAAAVVNGQVARSKGKDAAADLPPAPAKNKETYMLAYVRRDWHSRQGFRPPATAPAPQPRGAALRRNVAAARRPPTPPTADAAVRASAPAAARDYALRRVAAHDAMCADWRAHRASLELLVKRRREAYDELFRESQATPDVDGEKNPTCQFRLLEADALAAWVSGEAPADAGTKGRDAPNFFAPAGALVQTRALRRQHRLCGHGRLRAGDVGDFCIVRVVVYDRILADLKVGEVDDRLDNPEIQCSVCFDESRSELQETRRMDDEFNALLVALAAADAASKKPAAPARGASRQAAFHVSRKFFADLKKRCEKRSRVDKTAQKTLGLYFGDAAESAKPPPGAAAAAAAAQAAVVADDKFGDGDANKDLLCAHGALKLRASALAVDEACWDALRRLLPGSTHFDAAAPACTQCELQDVAQNRQDADRQDELRRHPSLVDLVERPRQLLALQAQHAAPNGGGGTASRPKQTRSTTAPVDYVEALMPCVSNFAGSLAEERRRRRRGGRLLPADFAPLDGAGTGAAGNAAPMPLRLVRRDWLSPWRAYHEALPGGARPAGLGDLGDLREHRCGCGAERPAGGAACAPPPWLLCALGLADCDGGLAAAVAAEACEAAASLHGLVMEAAEAYEAGTEALHFDPDDVEVVTDRQWRALVAEYGGDVDAAAIARGDAAGAWTLDPPPCAGCVSAAMRKAESSWRNFSNKPIFVQHLGADLLPFPVEASDDDGASDDDAPRDGAPRRRRRRATRSTDKAPPKVYALLHSAEDRVGLLMLRLCEQLPDAEPGKRRRTLAAAGAAPALALAVYKSDGTQLTDRDATLERAGVRARDTLYVRVCGAGDAANEHAATEADLFAYATIDEQRPAARGGGRAAETGFAGTMLQGAPAPQPEVIECDEDEADAADGPEPEAWQERVVVVIDDDDEASKAEPRASDKDISSVDPACAAADAARATADAVAASDAADAAYAVRTAADAAAAAPAASNGVGRRPGKRRASRSDRSPEDDAACRAAAHGYPATRTSARLSARQAARPPAPPPRQLDPVAAQMRKENYTQAEIQRVLALEKAELEVAKKDIYL